MSVEISGRHRRSQPIAQINVVPYIDVMLVLLIIFMVTAPMLTPSTVDLPSVGNAKQQPDQVVQVVVRDGEDLQLIDPAGRKQSVTLDDVANQVQAMQADAANPAVVISADKHVEYASVVAIMDKLQRAGIPRVGLSVVLAK